jgi:uncharacterized membrane protein (DUF2068 family)
MRIADRILSVALFAASFGNLYYWYRHFMGGSDAIATNAHWYTTFESSFPVADAWMTACAVLAGIGLWLGRSWGARFGLMAASAFFYLAAMDITFNIENGMYVLFASNEAIRYEVLINAICIILGTWTLIVSWRRSV